MRFDWIGLFPFYSWCSLPLVALVVDTLKYKKRVSVQYLVLKVSIMHHEIFDYYKAQFFCPNVLRAGLNLLGLRVGLYYAKALKAARVSHSALTLTNSSSNTVFLPFRALLGFSRPLSL